MRPLLKKLTAFFLLLVGAMPFLFTLFFLCKQQIIRHEMKEKLEEELLHTISLPKDEVVWVKYDQEIIVGDKMFDIKSFSEKNGVYFFIGLFDAEETALNDFLEKETDDKNENALSQLFQWLQAPCTSLAFDPCVIIDHTKISCFPILQHISSPFINILTPPPQA